jgi:solute carrier family 44 (choline transporter-like protein), member 1
LKSIFTFFIYKYTRSSFNRQMTIDTIFLCFCEDCERNDGLTRPFFMSRGLMEFVQNSKKALQVKDKQSGTAWTKPELTSTNANGQKGVTNISDNVD